MSQSPELQAKIAVWRQMAAEDRLTLDDYKEAIACLRNGRVSASAASDTSRAKSAKVAIPSADDLLGELGEL